MTYERAPEAAFERLVRVADASDECAREARALFGEVAKDAVGDRDPFAAARRVKAHLAKQGFTDDANVFLLDEMLARRSGNCLGLTLLIGAALIDRGHEVGFALRQNPFDDVHVAGEEHFAAITDARDGIDRDSRLPEATDRTRRFRFVPVEHASLLLRNEEGEEKPFEATNLTNALEVDSGWAPEAETVRRIDFDALSSIVLCDRSKLLLRSAHSPSERERVRRRSLRLTLRALRDWPGNREAWADVWRAVCDAPPSSRSDVLGRVSKARYEAIGGDDALFHFTRYRMSGDEQSLDRALERFPSYAEAWFEKRVAIPLARSAARDEVQRDLLVAAWMIAESEILDLESFYRMRASLLEKAFSRAEIEEVIASFA